MIRSRKWPQQWVGSVTCCCKELKSSKSSSLFVTIVINIHMNVEIATNNNRSSNGGHGFDKGWEISEKHYWCKFVSFWRIWPVDGKKANRWWLWGNSYIHMFKWFETGWFIHIDLKSFSEQDTDSTTPSWPRRKMMKLIIRKGIVKIR